MSMSPASGHLLPALRRSRPLAIDRDLVAALLVILLGTWLRLRLGAGRPLWLDETFTGAIAAEPDLAAVGRQILDDVNAPLYYLIAHAWSLGFGLSDAALRFPALVFSIAAPPLCLVPMPGIPRRVRLVWAMLAAVWTPGLPYAHEARCYSLAFLLGIGTTAAFAALLQAPSARRAVAWAALGSLAVLAHYDALIILGLQGAVFLAMHRRRALACWPGALPLVPLAAWMAIASDRIRAFGAAGVAWYDRLKVGDLWKIFDVVTGFGPAVALWLAVIGAALLLRRRSARTEPATSPPRAAVVAALTAAAATAVLLAIAFVKPTFTPRYLMIFEPGLLLGLALVAEASRRAVKAAPAVLVALVAIPALIAAANGLPPKAYNFEQASDDLAAAGARSLIFFWDNPNNAVEAPSQLAIVGGFFFHRRHLDVPVTPLIDPRGGDPNPKLLALARGPKAAILWAYDTRIHDTAATAFPPRIAATPGWSCRDYGAETVGILACLRTP